MLVAILFGGLILLFLWIISKKEENDLKKLPGPFSLPLFGISLSLIGLSQVTIFEKTREFYKLYGDRYMVKVPGRTILNLVNPDDFETVLSSQKNITKSYPYMLLEPWLGTGLLLSTGKKWHRRRKILTPAFHFNILREFSGVIMDHSSKLVAYLETKAGADVDVVSAISEFTLSTICETSMGTKLDGKDSSSRRYKEAILEIGRCTLKRLLTVWLHNDLVFWRSNSGQILQKALDDAHEFVEAVISDRKKKRKSNQTDGGHTDADNGEKKRLAMLDLLLDAEDRGEIDLSGIREEVNTFMFEGHDTTAMTISFAIMLLADHKHIQDKIYNECEAVFEGSNRPASMADLSSMKYLEAVIKETLRLFPVVPFISRLVTENFELGDGTKVPKGTEVALHIFDAHRRPDVFPDPEEFRPERFLQQDGRHTFAYVPFSAGPRNCIGQKFAMQEMKCVLSDICRSFVILPSSAGLQPPLAADLVLRPAKPILVQFLKR